MPDVGDHAPDFTLPSTAGEMRLSTLLKNGPLILAFYAEDNTPLCSNEVAMFRDDFEVIRELGAQIVAVSTDDLASHEAFAARLGGLPFPLASDADREVARLYGVLDDEGKRSQRAVFVIGTDGTVLHAEPWFQPGNPAQYEAIFRALGFEVMAKTTDLTTCSTRRSVRCYALRNAAFVSFKNSGFSTRSTPVIASAWPTCTIASCAASVAQIAVKPAVWLSPNAPTPKIG